MEEAGACKADEKQPNPVFVWHRIRVGGCEDGPYALCVCAGREYLLENAMSLVERCHESIAETKIQKNYRQATLKTLRCVNLQPLFHFEL